MDKDGNHVVDEHGKPVRKPLAAADLEVIRKRMLDREQEVGPDQYSVGKIVAGFSKGSLPLQEYGVSTI